jgi:hypothetical protein
LKKQQALERIERGLKTKYGILTEADLKAQSRATQYRELEKEFDGKNGLPKFVPIDVEAHAKSQMVLVITISCI